MTQPQCGAQISSSGTGRPISQPATRTGLRPYRSDRVPAARLVSALVMPKATMKVSGGGERAEREDLLGQQRQHGAFLADHAADEGVDRDEQGELGQVGAQPEPDRRCRRGGGHRPGARAWPVAAAQSSGPPTRTASRGARPVRAGWRRSRRVRRARTSPSSAGRQLGRAARRGHRARHGGRRAGARRRTRCPGARRRPVAASIWSGPTSRVVAQRLRRRRSSAATPPASSPRDLLEADGRARATRCRRDPGRGCGR